MKRLALPALAAVAAAALIGLLAFGLVSRAGDSSLDQAVASGERPPAASRELPVLGARAGATRSVADLRGKVVVLNFWASWCEPCKAEAPVLAAAQRRLQREDAGTVLGVTWDDSTPDSLQFVREQGIDYPNVRDVGKKLARDYALNGLPETFVIDARGRIAGLYRGQITQKWIDDALDRAIG